MSLVNSNFRESNAQRGYYDQLLTAWDVAYEEQDWLKLISRYGNGFDVLNFLNMAGAEMDLGSNNITIIEEGVRERPVTVSIPQSLSAPIDPVITFATSDDSDDYVREGMSLLVPASYVTGQDYDLELRLYKDGADWKGKSFSGTATIAEAITTKQFILSASSFGEGADGIDPMGDGFYERSTDGRILKESCAIEGGKMFNEVFQAVKSKYGEAGLYNKAMQDASFRLDSQVDAALLTANPNTNTANLKTTSISGNSNTVRSTKGLIPIMKELAQELTWSTDFDMDKFRAIKGYLEAVGILNREVDFLMGTDLCANVEDANIEWLKTNSTGHSFYEKMNEVGFYAQQVKINSVMFNLMELHSFANVNKFGIDEYGYRDMGFLMPKGEHTVTMKNHGRPDESMKLPHLTLGFANNNGENRRRVATHVKGNVNFPAGAAAANSYDGVKFDFLTHIIPIYNHIYQTILVTKDASGGVGA